MAIDLSTLLDGGAVLPIGEATSRKAAIVMLASALAGVVALDARTITEAVMEREHLGSTGVGEGVAIPHARLKGLKRPVGGYLRLRSGVDFDSIDDRPCDLIFMLLAPDSAGADHLRALAQVSRAFRQPSTRDQLRQTETEDGVRAILCQSSENVSAA